MDKVLGNLDHGLIFVVSAPAGTGKTTLTQMLIKEFSCVVQSVSYTTRNPRVGEVNGIDYNFITEESFLQKIEENEFLEYVKVYDNYYGTSKKWVNEQLNRGKHVVLVIDTQGGNLLRDKCDATYIFIMPPSVNEQKRRLEARSSESEETLKKRVDWSEQEIEGGKNYDYFITNANLEVSYEVFRSIFIAEEHKRKV